jgi:hypothetical protein
VIFIIFNTFLLLYILEQPRQFPTYHCACHTYSFFFRSRPGRLATGLRLSTSKMRTSFFLPFKQQVIEELRGKSGQL